MADIVFLIDASGSMGPCIDALKANIETFIDFLSHGEGNHVSPVQDWRAKVVGYRDFEEDAEPLVDNPFTRDASALKSQLAALQAEGGDDTPESLLDALYRVANMGQMEDPLRQMDALPSQSAPCGSLQSLRPCSGRTFTSGPTPVLGTLNKARPPERLGRACSIVTST